MDEKTYDVVSIDQVTLSEMNDILTTAVEGGINYWAEVRNYSWENVPIVTVEVREEDQESAEKPGWHAVSAMDILRIVSQIRNHSSQAKGWNIREIVDQHDADIADIAVQLAIFGEVIYG